MNYNDEQLAFIQSDIQDLCLIGIPGGGKSSCIMKFISDKVASGKLTPKQFMILTFCRGARDSFIEKSIEHTNSEIPIFTYDNVRTLHSFAGKISYKLNIRNTMSTVIVATMYAIQDSKADLRKRVDILSELKVIIVDEAQDLSRVQRKFIFNLKEKINVPIVLVGDPNQTIFQFQGSDDTVLIDHSKDAKSIKLIKNYRSTPKIVGFLNKLRPWANTVRMQANREDRGAFKKPFIFFGNEKEIMNDMIKHIMISKNNKNIDLKDSAIIGPVKRCTYYNQGHESIGLQDAVNACNKRGIPFVKHYTDGMCYESCMPGLREGKINIYTGHCSKGIEFDTVYVLNFNINTQNINPTQVDYNHFKYLWYVILSRAKNNLRIYVFDKKMPWPVLFKIPDNTYDSNKSIKDAIRYEFVPRLEYRPIQIGVLNAIRDMNDEARYALEKCYTIISKREKRIKNKNRPSRYSQEITGCDMSMYFGILAENIFEMIYNGGTTTLVEREKGALKRFLCLNSRNERDTYKKMKKRFSFIDNYVNMDTLREQRNQLTVGENELYARLLAKVGDKTPTKKGSDEDDVILIIIDKNDPLIYDDREVLEKLIYDFERTLDVKFLLRIVFYAYQRKNQYGSFWNNYTFEMIEKVIKKNNMISNIQSFINYIRDEHPNLWFQKRLVNSTIPIVGIIDCYDMWGIYDIKYTKKFNDDNFLQLIMYHSLFDHEFKKDLQLELWNIKKGVIANIKLSVHNVDCFYKILSESTGLELKPKDKTLA